MELQKIQKLLMSYPKFSDFKKLEVKLLKKNKKDEYWGTSVKRFVRMTDETNGITETYKVEGVIYLNLKDISDTGKLLQVVAEEAAHLLDDGPGLIAEIYNYLKEEA